MNAPQEPIFVFTDNLSVFESIDEVGPYHEWRETVLAYDKDGNTFEIPPTPGASRISLQGNRRKELIRQLRLQLIGLAIDHPKFMQMDKWAVKHAPDDEVIRLAAQKFLIPHALPFWNAWRISLVLIGGCVLVVSLLLHKLRS